MPWSSVAKLSQKPKVVLKFEWEHYFKLIFVIRKLCICGFAEVLSTQKLVGSANLRKIYGPQIRKLSHLRKLRKSDKIKFANLRICDLQNLIADGPPLVLSAPVHSISSWIFLAINFWQGLFFRSNKLPGGRLCAGGPVPVPTGPAAPGGGRGGWWRHTVSAGRPCPLRQVSRLHPVTLRQEGTVWVWRRRI